MKYKTRNTTHKYKAIPTTYNGIKFPSKLECEVYICLLRLLRSNKIKSIKTQHSIPLKCVSGKVVGKYIADFLVKLNDGKEIVVEAKGVETPLWKWKYKHYISQYDTPLLVINNKNISNINNLIKNL